MGRAVPEVFKSLEWLWGAGAVLLYGSSVCVAGLVGLGICAAFGAVPRVVLLSFYLPVGAYICLLVLILLCGLLHRVVPLPAEGEYSLERRGEVMRWMLHAGIFNYIRLPGFVRLVHANPLLRRLYYGLAGAKIDPSVVISYEAVLLDPFLIEIGAHSKIGEYAVLVGHYAEQDRFFIGKVQIGRDVLVGADAGIGPGVRVGDGAVVKATAKIGPNTQVPAGAVWGGPVAWRPQASPAGEEEDDGSV